MASGVTVKQIRAEFKHWEHPIYGTKHILVDPCRQSGVSCAGPGITSTAELSSLACSAAITLQLTPGSAAQGRSTPPLPDATREDNVDPQVECSGC